MDPLAELKQEGELVEFKERLMGDGWVMLTEAVEVFPALSVTVTRAVPAGNEEAVAVDSPLFHEYE